MKRLFALGIAAFGAAVGALSGCQQVSINGSTVMVNGGSAPLVQGSGTVGREDRVVAGIDRVRFEGVGKLLITQGDEERLSVEADDNLVPLLITEVRRGTLVIGTKSGASFRTSSPIVFRLAVRRLDGIVVSGSGDAEASALDCPSLRLELSGSGSIRAAGRAERAEYVVSGSGTLDAEPLTAEHLSATLPGSGSIALDAHGDCDIALGGSGNVRGRVDCERLVASIGGVGGIDLSGRAASQEVAIGGSGTYRATAVACDAAAATISGCGSAELRADRTLDARISGSGSIRYGGSPTVSSRVTGVGSIDRL